MVATVTYCTTTSAGLDCESIWAELELRNGPVERSMRKALARLNQSHTEDISVSIQYTVLYRDIN